MENINSINQILSEIELLKNKVYSLIDNTLDEAKEIEGITRISKNIFTIPFSKLNKWNLSYEHYSTPTQIKLIKEQIRNKTKIDGILNYIKETYKNKKIFVGSGYDRYSIEINNETKKVLEKILQDMGA